MDPYLLTVKYIYNKNQLENTDDSLDDFFSNGNSFPKFVAILFGIDKVPGTVFCKNKYQVQNNNSKALSFLGEKNPFFKSYQADFSNLKNQISLIQLIMSKIYFKINRNTFLKKCNDFIQSKGYQISNFSEFVSGNGFMKLLNVSSNGSIPPEINPVNDDQLIEQLRKYLNSLKIHAVIDKDSLLPTNHDILMYQAMIIIDHEIINKSNEDQAQNDTETSIDSNDSNQIQEDDSSLQQPSSKTNDDSQKNSSQKKESSENLSKNNDENITLSSEESSLNNDEKRISLNEFVHKQTLDNLDEDLKEISEASLEENIQSSDLLILPKSSYLNIVNNLMEVNNQHGIMAFSDFEKGEILPKIVEILFKEKIPFIVENPSSNDQMMNNMSTLYFINKINPDFNPRNYNLSNENDLKDLIRILFKKNILTREYISQIKEEIDQILNTYQRSINNFNRDWDDGVNFVALLNFLSNGLITFPPDEKLDITKLKEMFVRANCPVILEDDSLFGNLDEFVILYQIKIILDEIKIKKISIPKNNLKENHDTEVKKKTNENDNSNENGYVYEKNSTPILRLFNLIGAKVGLHFNSFDDIINGAKIHIFVAHLIGIPSIPGTKNDSNSESENFKAVLNYLVENNKLFRYSLFDFNDESNKNLNIQWFATTLLEQYFLKESKKKLIKMTSEILGEKILFKEIKQVFLYGNGFYKILGQENNFSNNNYYDEDSLLKAFQKVDVPFIMDDDSLTNVNNDYICFQLQLIFDKLIKPNQTEEKPKVKKDKFISKLTFVPEEIKTTSTDELKISDLLLNIGNKKKESSNNEQEVTNKLPHLKTSNLFQDIGQLTQFINQYDIINKTKEQNKLSEQKTKELAGIKENLKHVESKVPQKIQVTNIPKQENKIDNNPDFPLSYDLYSYKSFIPEPEKIDQEANDNFSKLFQTTLNDFVSQKQTAEKKSGEEKKPKINYKPDKTLKSYRLFEYKENEWKYNSLIWPDFIQDNKLQKDDILYWILFTPSGTTDINAENDQTYNMIKTITMTKAIEATIDSSIYVELIYGGNINDIHNRFEINTMFTQNENIAFIQLRYPLSLKDTKIIDNMQSILTLQSSYIISLYPKTTIDESLRIVNTSLHQAAQSPYFNNISTGISFVLKNVPIELTPEMKELVNNPSFTKILDKKLNKENIFFKNLRKSYEYAMATINWININNYETYHHFLETMINFCQQNFFDQCKLLKITQYLSFLKIITPINNQIEMCSFMNNISNTFLLEKIIQQKSLFTYNNTITYNQAVFNEFASSNSINTEKDSIVTVLIVNSSRQDYDSVSRFISKTNVSQPGNDPSFFVRMKYCGIIEELSDQYNVKLKGKDKISKSHLVLIYVDEPLNNYYYNNYYDNYLKFIIAIASKCDFAITIVNPSKIREQLKQTNKFINIMNLHSDLNNIPFNHIYVIKNYLEDARCCEEINNKIESIYNRFSLDIFNQDSCRAFLKRIFYLLNNTEKSVSFYNKRFSLVDEQEIDPFRIVIFKNIIKVIKKVKESDKVIENIIYSLLDEESLLNEIKLYINKYNDEDDIINSIKGKFLFLICQSINNNNNNLYSFFLKLQNRIIDYVIVQYGNEYVKQITSKKFIWSEVCQDVFDFINNSVTYINADFIHFLKESCLKKIKDAIYKEVESCGENIGIGLKIYIYSKLIEDFEKSILECLAKIDTTFMNTQLFEKEKVELTQDQIEQDSVKYILAVKESIKELTVEIITDDDIEKEIPRDY